MGRSSWSQSGHWGLLGGRVRREVMPSQAMAMGVSGCVTWSQAPPCIFGEASYPPLHAAWSSSNRRD